MAKLKDFIIKKLGGYTSSEFTMAAGCRFQQPHIISNTDFEQVNAELHIPSLEWYRLKSETSNKVIKNELMQNVAKQIEPFVEFTVDESHNKELDVIVYAKVYVMYPLLKSQYME